MEAKFTKGPWYCDANKHGDLLVREPTNGLIIADVLALDSSDEHERNQELIAAAPSLYHALSAAVEIIDKWIEPETMGVVRSGDGVLGHYLRDEYLMNFRAALLRASPTEEPALPPQAPSAGVTDRD